VLKPQANANNDEDALFPPVKSSLTISSTTGSISKQQFTISINIKSHVGPLLNNSNGPQTQTSPTQASSPTNFTNLLQSSNNQVKSPTYNKNQFETSEMNGGATPFSHKTNDYINTNLPTPGNSPINAKKVNAIVFDLRLNS
jgi:hypothetical protein